MPNGAVIKGGAEEKGGSRKNPKSRRQLKIKKALEKGSSWTCPKGKLLKTPHPEKRGGVSGEATPRQVLKRPKVSGKASEVLQKAWGRADLMGRHVPFGKKGWTGKVLLKRRLIGPQRGRNRDPQKIGIASKKLSTRIVSGKGVTVERLKMFLKKI